MGQRVLVLGAGASFGARKGLRVGAADEPLPPLGRGLARYLLDWLDANDPDRTLRPQRWFHFPSNPLCANYTGQKIWENQLLGEVRQALATVAEQEKSDYARPATPFEVLMDSWSTSEHDDHLHLVQHLLVYAMTWGYRCAFDERPDRFDDLLAWFLPTVIVSVNYDTLVEEALKRRSCRRSYPGLEGPRAPEGPSILQVSSGEGAVVPMFKPHGSVNWHSIHPFNVSASEEVAERLSKARPTRIVERGNFVAPQTWASYASESRSNLLYEMEEAPETGEPIVAIYGTGKLLMDNPLHVDEHREACFAELRSSPISRVLAIGIRPVSKEDDPFVWQLLKQLGQGDSEKIYVSPSPTECDEMRARGFRADQATLAEFLDGCERAASTLPASRGR